MFLLQETPPYNVNSPSAASNQPSDQRFDAEKGKTEEETGGEHVESPAKDLNKQFVMVPVAQPAEAAPPTSDDEKLKLLLDGLQSISPHALQILAAAAQNASQKLECETSKQVEGESSKQGRGGKESTSRQRRTSQKAVRFDPWMELDTKPRKAKAAKPNVRKANSAKPKSKASTQAGPSDTSFVAAPAIKVERKRGIDGRNTNRVALRPVWRSWRLSIRIIYTVCLYYGDPMVDSAVQSREKWLSSLSPLCVLRDLLSEDSAQCWNTYN